jgi:thioredoxin reductase (NADPH)
MQDTSMYESLIIGGGPAGLSAALYLARLDRKVALFDAGQGRSTWHQVNHNYLGFPGGVPAKQLRELGRQQLAEYNQVEILDHKIEALERNKNGTFTAGGQAGDWQGQTVIICAGVLDQYPHFEGWHEYVGRSMFWCLVCDGYGAKGKRVLVAGNSNSTVVEALQLTRYTQQLTVLTNSHECLIDEVHQKRLAKAKIPLVLDKIEKAVGKDGCFEAIITQSGNRLELDQLFCHRAHVPQTKLALLLGLELDEEGYILTDTAQQTNVPGAFAAGDVTLIYSHQIATAVHEGAQAALSANSYLYPPELRG